MANDDAARTGYLVDAYIAGDGRLEFWLMDADANLRAPIQLLGSIVRDDQLSEEPEIAIRIRIDTDGLEGDGALDRVRAVEQLRVEDLSKRTERWEALDSAGVAEPVTEGNE